MLLVWLFLGAVTGEDVQLNTTYEGVIGEQQYFYQFYPNGTNIYMAYLTSSTYINSSSAPITVQLIFQDQVGRLSTNIAAPTFSNNTFVSATSVGYVCGADDITYFIIIPAGQIGTKFSFRLEGLQSRLRPGQAMNATVDYRNQDFIDWFYFDNVDKTGKPLKVSVSSSDPNMTAVLAGWKTECPDLIQYLRDTGGTDDGNGGVLAYLTFSTQGVLHLSDAQMPYIKPGRWFFGLIPGTSSAGDIKNVTLTVEYGYNSEEFSKAMLIPPIILSCAVIVLVTLSVMTMTGFTNKLGYKETTKKRFTWSYFRTALSISVVFLVPGIQFILNQVLLMNITGNRDMCFYNEQCQIPYSSYGIASWNNVYSNIGYIIVGVGFICYIYTFRFFSRKDRVNVGIPMDSSIPYAMGIAIVMEGFASSLYHLCPSPIIFQFDTANMFIIGVLGLSELFRRALYKPHETTVFLFIAMLITLNYVGSLADAAHKTQESREVQKILTGLIFTLLSLFFLLFLFPFMMKEEVVRYGDFFRNFRGEMAKVTKTRLILFITLYIVNSLILLVPNLLNERVGDFANTFLAMLVVSQIISVVAYEFSNSHLLTKMPRSFLFMKLFLFAIFLTLWGLALYFFRKDTSDKGESPARSRELNSPCILGQFYDAHDMWHFLSAAGLLAMCLVFYHLDLNAAYDKILIGEGQWIRRAEQRKTRQKSAQQENCGVGKLVEEENDLVKDDEIAALLTDSTESAGEEI